MDRKRKRRPDGKSEDNNRRLLRHGENNIEHRQADKNHHLNQYRRRVWNWFWYVGIFSIITSLIFFFNNLANRTVHIQAQKGATRRCSPSQRHNKLLIFLLAKNESKILKRDFPVKVASKDEMETTATGPRNDESKAKPSGTRRFIIDMSRQL